MKFIRKNLIIPALWIGSTLSAQVVATGDTLICPPGAATLSATTTLTTTTNYTTSSIPYLPYSYNSGVFVTMSDDSQTGPFPIGFNFEFFGVCYTDFYIGSNGWIAFSPQATTFTSAPIPSNNTSIPANCIMGPWQDWHPGIPGGPYINYQTQGVAPFRRLVVSWNNCPMFSCTSTLGTFQIVIYETTNIIENFLLDKPNCLAWANGTAVQGLHDPTRTIGITIPGRNSTQWTATNEGWRYTPNGVPTISWYQVGNPTALGTGATFNVNPSVPTNYAAVVTDVCTGFTFSDTVSVGILPPPVAGTASANPTSVCSGQSATLTLTGSTGNIQWQVSPDGITWFNVPGGTSSSISTGPLSSSLYFQAFITPGPGTCGTATSNIILVTVNPAPPADAGLNTTICTGDSATLTGTGGVSYSWSPGPLTGSSVTVGPAVNTTYTLTVTDANGCTATDQVTVNLSSITTNAGADVSLCSGNQATLLASANGATSYAWSPPTGLSSTTQPNPVANPTTTTTYVVTATNQYGCVDNDTIVVTVTPAPPITVSNDTTICAGGSVGLLASGAQSYLWSPATGLSSTTQANPTATPSVTTTYVVQGDNGGCYDYDTVTVNVTPPPAAFAGPDFSICIGSQGTLSATGGLQYTWLPTTGIIGNPNQANITINPTTGITYTVTVIGPGGCIATDQVTVGVNPLPIVNAVSNDYTICAGSSANLSASGAAGYVWSPSSGLSSTISAVPTATPGNSTIYTVTGTDANGCTDTDTVQINIIPLPQFSLIYGNPTLCGDTTGTINIGSIVGGQGPFTYTVNGVPSTPNGNGAFGNYTAGTYTVQVTDAAGCQSSGTAGIWVDYSQLNITASATPSTGVAPQFINFYSTGAGGINNYSWDFGDGNNAATQNPFNTYTLPGVYTVIVTGFNDNPSCVSYDTLTIEIFPEAIVITPNVFTPNGDGMNDLFISDLQGVKEIRYTIYNRWGNLIREVDGITNGWDGKNKNGSEVEDGTYYYVLTVTDYNDVAKEIPGFVQLIRAPK